MPRFTLRLRKEPTNCPQTLKQTAKLSLAQRDVVAYRDGKEVGRWPWWIKSKPDRRNRYTHLNCMRYRIEWMADAPLPDNT